VLAAPGRVLPANLVAIEELARAGQPRLRSVLQTA